MPQSQLGDFLANHLWFWASYRPKLNVKGKISKSVIILARKATYPTIIGFKMKKPVIKGRKRFISLKLSFKLCNLHWILLFPSWKLSMASREISSEVTILSTTITLPHIKGSNFQQFLPFNFRKDYQYSCIFICGLACSTGSWFYRFLRKTMQTFCQTSSVRSMNQTRPNTIT